MISSFFFHFFFIFFFFSSYCPLQIWALETCITDEKFCYQDNPKTIKARSFNLGQLIEDDEYIT